MWIVVKLHTIDRAAFNRHFRPGPGETSLTTPLLDDYPSMPANEILGLYTQQFKELKWFPGTGASALTVNLLPLYWVRTQLTYQ
jgi:hypothetical protein